MAWLLESESSGWLSESFPGFFGRAMHVSIFQYFPEPIREPLQNELPKEVRIENSDSILRIKIQHCQIVEKKYLDFWNLMKIETKRIRRWNKADREQRHCAWISRCKECYVFLCFAWRWGGFHFGDWDCASCFIVLPVTVWLPVIGLSRLMYFLSFAYLFAKVQVVMNNIK